MKGRKRWEDHLINPDKWETLHHMMPVKCQDIVDRPEHGPIGIGKHPDFGWFIAMSGQGPAIIWTEND